MTNRTAGAASVRKDLRSLCEGGRCATRAEVDEPFQTRAPTRTDPRLLQANERTMLAWLRTGLALMTFGFVIARIGVWVRLLSGMTKPSTGGTAWIGAAFLALGVVSTGFGVRRFVVNRRAIIAGVELSGDRFVVVFGTVITVLGAALGAYVLSLLE